jgi:hypothetical protein
MRRRRPTRQLPPLVAAVLLLACLAILGQLRPVGAQGLEEVDLDAEGGQQRLREQPEAVATLSPPPASTNEQQAAAAAASAAAAAEALAWDLLDVARREGDKQQEQPAATEPGLVEGLNAGIFRPLLPAIEAEQQRLPGVYRFFPWVRTRFATLPTNQPTNQPLRLNK